MSPPKGGRAPQPSIGHLTTLQSTRIITAVAALCLLIGAGGRAAAQSGTDAPIFNRFAGPPEPAREQRLFEIPFALRPQTNADADVQQNLGLGYYIGIRPRNRVYVSLGLNYFQAEWAPDSRVVKQVELKQVDVSQQINFWVQRWFALSVGLGIGVLDALVQFQDNDYQHRQGLYVPIQLGMIVPLGSTYVVSLRAVHTPYAGSAPMVSHSRAMVGFGYNF